MNRNNKLFIAILLIWSLGPFLLQIYTSFSSPDSIVKPINLSQHVWTLENYTQVLKANPPFWRYLLNSTLVGLISTFSTLLLAIPAAYSISTASNYYKRFLKTLLLGSSLFPYVLLFLSLLEIARHFELGNNLIFISIPYSALSLPLAKLL